MLMWMLVLRMKSRRLEEARLQGSEEETWERGNDGKYVGDIRGYSSTAV